MAENDLSKIVALIMDNPDLVDRIKGLASGADKEISPPTSEIEIKEDCADKEIKHQAAESNTRTHRRDLFEALKPYLSEQRGKAVETMISIVDILDMIKTR